MGRLVTIAILFLICHDLFSQTRTITGKVIGGGESLPGVNVIEKGTTNGTITDAKGNFSIEVSSEEDVILLFSFMCPVIERRIKKDEFHIVFKIKSYDIVRRLYALIGSSMLKSQEGSFVRITTSVGYNYHYYKFGVGAEVNFVPVLKNNNQLGLPIYGSYSITNKLKFLLGAGYYWGLENEPITNEVKILTGLILKKRRFAFDLRYYNGTKSFATNEKSSLSQNLNFGLRYYVK